MFDRPWQATIAVGLLLVLVHVVVTSGNGFRLPDTLRDRVGASPETTLERPWAHFTAPFFHDDLLHLAYNLALMLIALPVALRAIGTAQGLTAAYLASPFTGILVNLAIILPLAAAGWSYAGSAVDVRLVGASVMIVAAIGLALATRAWAPAKIVLTVLAIVAYELILAATGTTRPFVAGYHLGGLATGLALGPWLSS